MGTVKFSWHVDGIFPRGTDGSHINSVSGNKDGSLIVTGDDWCNVRIFRDPVIREESATPTVVTPSSSLTACSRTTASSPSVVTTRLSCSGNYAEHRAFSDF